MQKTGRAGSFVCRKGEPVEHWIGIIDRLAKMTNLSAAGKPTTFTGISSGAWFGEGSLLKDEPWRYDIGALRDSQMRLHAARDLHMAAGQRYSIQPVFAVAAQ